MRLTDTLESILSAESHEGYSNLLRIELNIQKLQSYQTTFFRSLNSLLWKNVSVSRKKDFIVSISK